MASSGIRSRLYLLCYPFEYFTNFQLPELWSIANYFGFHINIIHADLHKSPFLLFNVASEEHAEKIMSKTFLAKSLYELWGQGETFPELKKSIKSCPLEYKAPFFDKDNSWCIRSESFQKHQSQEDKVHRIDTILDGDTLPFKGSVKLKDPDSLFGLFVAYDKIDGFPANDPQQIYFGRWIGDGQKCVARKYNLQERKFIGNTSMNVVLSMVMANMALVKKNHFVFDPFVGTGSLLIACAHLGAYVIGSDIDYNILHGRGRASRKGVKWRGPDDNLRSSLKQYNLQHLYMDVLLLDTSKQDVWRHQTYFDAIITDPPYGIREKTTKCGGTDKMSSDCDSNGENSKSSYDLQDIFLDLLNFAAKHLVLGGRLLYWLPVVSPEYSDKHIPIHPCLKLIANSEQVLSSFISRRLITMEKICNLENLEMKASMEENPYASATFRDKYFKFVNHSQSIIENEDGNEMNNVEKSFTSNVNDVHCEISCNKVS